MKYIKWIGGVALASAVVVNALLAGAAVGDPTFVKCSPDCLSHSETLTAGEKTTLDGCLKNVWSVADVSNLQTVRCAVDAQGAMTCACMESRTVTEANYIIIEAADQVASYTSSAGGNVTYTHVEKSSPVSTANGNCFRDLAETAIVGIDKTKMYTFTVEKNGADLKASFDEHATNTPANYVALKAVDRVRMLTGVVAE